MSNLMYAGLLAGTVAGVAALLLTSRRPGSRVGDGAPKESEDSASTQESHDSASSSSAADVGPEQTSKKSRRRGGSTKAALQAKMEANAAEDATRGMLPPLEKGARVWDSKTQSEVTVVKVYYDDDPPYYAVRVESGAERDTVRAKLWTADERAAEAAAKVRSACLCYRDGRPAHSRVPFALAAAARGRDRGRRVRGGAAPRRKRREEVVEVTAAEAGQEVTLSSAPRDGPAKQRRVRARV